MTSREQLGQSFRWTMVLAILSSIPLDACADPWPVDLVHPINVTQVTTRTTSETIFPPTGLPEPPALSVKVLTAPIALRQQVNATFCEPRSLDTNDPTRLHAGIDIEAPLGTPVFTIREGKVGPLAANLRGLDNEFIQVGEYRYRHIDIDKDLWSVAGEYENFPRKLPLRLPAGTYIGSTKPIPSYRYPHLHLERVTVEDGTNAYANPLFMLEPWADSTPPVTYSRGEATNTWNNPALRIVRAFDSKQSSEAERAPKPFSEVTDPTGAEPLPIPLVEGDAAILLRCRDGLACTAAAAAGGATGGSDIVAPLSIGYHIDPVAQGSGAASGVATVFNLDFRNSVPFGREGGATAEFATAGFFLNIYWVNSELGSRVADRAGQFDYILTNQRASQDSWHSDSAFTRNGRYVVATLLEDLGARRGTEVRQLGNVRSTRRTIYICNKARIEIATDEVTGKVDETVAGSRMRLMGYNFFAPGFLPDRRLPQVYLRQGTDAPRLLPVAAPTTPIGQGLGDNSRGFLEVTIPPDVREGAAYLEVDFQCDPNDPNDLHHGAQHPIRIGSSRRFLLEIVNSSNVMLYDSESVTLSTVATRGNGSSFLGGSISAQGNHLAYFQLRPCSTCPYGLGISADVYDRSSGTSAVVTEGVIRDWAPISADGTRLLYAQEVPQPSVVLETLVVANLPSGAGAPSSFTTVPIPPFTFIFQGSMSLSPNGKYCSYELMSLFYGTFSLMLKEIDSTAAPIVLAAGAESIQTQAISGYLVRQSFVGDDGVVAANAYTGSRSGNVSVALVIRSPTDLFPLEPGSTRSILGFSSDSQTVLLDGGVPWLAPSVPPYELIHLGSVATTETLPLQWPAKVALALSPDGRFVPFMSTRPNFSYGLSVLDLKANDEVIDVAVPEPFIPGLTLGGITSNLQALPTVGAAFP